MRAKFTRIVALLMGALLFFYQIPSLSIWADDRAAGERAAHAAISGAGEVPADASNTEAEVPAASAEAAGEDEARRGGDAPTPSATEDEEGGDAPTPSAAESERGGDVPRPSGAESEPEASRPETETPSEAPRPAQEPAQSDGSARSEAGGADEALGRDERLPRADAPLEEGSTPSPVRGPSPARGQLALSSLSFSQDQTRYNLYEDTQDSMFELRYLAPAPGTRNNVLIVKIPAYGATFLGLPEVGSRITEVRLLDSHTMAIRLADFLETEQVIQFKLKRTQLTQAAAEQWMDEGTLPETTIEAAVYTHGASLETTESAGQLDTSFVYARMRPALYQDAPAFTMEAQYSVTVSSVAELTDEMMGEWGFASAGGNTLYSYVNPNSPGLKYRIRAVHNGDVPLTEITGIKVYVPDEKLALKGISDFPAIARQTSTIINADLDQIWKNWAVGPRQQDAAGSYYVLTPPARCFNLGANDELSDYISGMRLLWQLVDADEELDYRPDDYLSLSAADTELLCRIPSGTPDATDKRYAHAGPQVRTMARETRDTVYNAYAPERHRGNGSNTNVTAGSYQSGKLFTVASNLYLRQEVLSPGGAKVVKEWVPAYEGPLTQSYAFPYAIQPKVLELVDGNRSAAGIRTWNENVLAQVRYTLRGADGSLRELSLPQEKIDAANLFFRTPAATGGEGHRIAFDLAEGESIAALELEWSKFRTRLRYGYPVSNQTGRPAENFTQPGAQFPHQLRGFDRRGYAMFSVAAYFDYQVGTHHDPAQTLPIAENDRAQVKYAIRTDGAAPLAGVDADNYLWFTFKSPLCPELYGEPYYNPLNPNQNLSEQLHHLGEAGSFVMGSVGLDIGQYGERSDEMRDPVIDLAMRFGLRQDRPLSAYQLEYDKNYWEKRIGGISEDEALAFLSGELTAMPKLSGWVFTYDTNLGAGKRFTVPQIDAPAGQRIQIPLAAGEYFKSLRLSYEGTFLAAHDGVADTKTKLILLRDIALRPLRENPFSGERVRITPDFQNAYIALDGVARWENCPSIPAEGQRMTSPHVGTYAAFAQTPYAKLWETRRITLSDRRLSNGTAIPGPTLPGTVKTVYQGDSLKDVMAFNAVINKIEGGPSGANLLLPFSLDETVFIEWKDDEVLFDPATTKLMGLSVATGDVSYEWVRANDGRRFLKLRHQPGTDRPKDMPALSHPGYFTDVYSVDQFNAFGSGATWNAFGTLELGFKTLPGARLGLHNPIGEVYVDYSDLLERYDAPRFAVADGDFGPGVSKYVFENAGPDLLQLSDSASTEENKLYRYDLSAYRFNVIKLTGLKNDIVPGIDGVYDFADRTTNFYDHQAGALSLLNSLTGPDNLEVYNFTTYIALPRAGQATGDRINDYGLWLRGEPQLLSDSTGQGRDNLVLAYTTDERPNDGSDYGFLPQNEADWARVTGVKVQVKYMPAATAVNLSLDLRAERKDRLGELNAYVGASSAYQFGSAGVPDAAVNRTELEAVRFVYEDYLVNRESALVFLDGYDENGRRTLAQSAAEPPLKGVQLRLLDKDGLTEIDRAVTDARGYFSLRSFKREAGQIVELILPERAVPGDASSAPARWRLTRQSERAPIADLNDSDFDRASNRLVLPRLQTNGLPNLSAGLLRLPEIEAADIELYIGESAVLDASMREFLGQSLPDSAYNLAFSAAEDAQIAAVTARSAVLTGMQPAYSASTAVRGLREGLTHATVSTVNLLGDPVEKRISIRVKMPYTSLPVEKQWVDDDDALRGRPARVEVLLKRSVAGGAEETLARSLTLTGEGENPWKGRFTDLPQYDREGRRYTYTVEERAPNPNYRAEVLAGVDGGYILRNTLKQFSLTGQKVWVQQGSVAPAGLTVQLFRSDDMQRPLRELAIDASMADPGDARRWRFTFDGLLEFDAQGRPYAYSLREKDLPAGYSARSGGMTLTNTNLPDSPIQVAKLWDHTGAPPALRPQTVTIKLWRDNPAPAAGDAPFRTVELSAAVGWKHTFAIPEHEARGHSFSITEEAVPGYSVSYGTAAAGDGSGLDEGTLYAKNTFVMTYVEVKGSKTWEEVPAGVVAPPVRFMLWRNNPDPQAGDLPFRTLSLEANDLSAGARQDFAFTGLEQYDADGAAYVYTLTEEALEGYESRAEDNDFTNRYAPQALTYRFGEVEKAVQGAHAPEASFRILLEPLDEAAALPADAQEGRSWLEIRAGEQRAFPELSLTRPGLYRYRISEEAGGAPGWTYDGRRYVLTLTVRDDTGRLRLSERLEVEAAPGAAPTGAERLLFVNDYKHLLTYDLNHDAQAQPRLSERLAGDRPLSEAALYRSAAGAREGYDFAGWYLDPETTRPAEGAVIVADTVLYARWEERPAPQPSPTPTPGPSPQPEPSPGPAPSQDPQPSPNSRPSPGPEPRPAAASDESGRMAPTREALPRTGEAAALPSWSLALAGALALSLGIKLARRRRRRD